MENSKTTRKTLRMFYSIKEIAQMMDISYTTFRREMRRGALHKHLTALGWNPYQRLCKAQVLEIFKVLGYPEGYEHYEVRE